jgi:magnesium-transporting ATPase (P-type)
MSHHTNQTHLFLSLRYFKIVCLSFVEIQFHVAYGGHNYEHEFIRNRDITSIIDPVIALVLSMFILSFIFVIVLFYLSESESVHVCIVCLYIYIPIGHPVIKKGGW